MYEHATRFWELKEKITQIVSLQEFAPDPIRTRLGIMRQASVAPIDRQVLDKINSCVLTTRGGLLAMFCQLVSRSPHARNTWILTYARECFTLMEQGDTSA